MIGSIGDRIREFHHGKTYARTKAKHGKAVANRQVVAAAYHSAGKGRTIGSIHKAARKK